MMRNRRLAITGVAIVAAIGLSGCGPAKSPGTAGGTAASTAASTAAQPAAQPADPAAELAAAATKLSGQSLRLKLRMAAGLNARGVADRSGDRMDLTMTLGTSGQESKVTMRKIGDDIWMRFDGALGSMLGASADKWLHVDASKVPEGSAFSMSNGNPKDAAKMIAAATSVEKTGEGSYRGKLDMTKAPGVDRKSLEALGAKAKAVPFTAKTDSAGRLTELVLDVDALAPGAGKMTTTYYDFGTEVSVEAPPASQVREMPKELLGVVTA